MTEQGVARLLVEKEQHDKEYAEYVATLVDEKDELQYGNSMKKAGYGGEKNVSKT